MAKSRLSPIVVGVRGEGYGIEETRNGDGVGYGLREIRRVEILGTERSLFAFTDDPRLRI